MDYEVEQELNELRNIISELSGQTNKISSNLNAIASAQRTNTSSSSNNTTAQNNNVSGVTRYQQIAEQENKKDDQYKQNIKVAFGHSIDMLASFGGALVSSNKGLQKYSQTIDSLGKGASALGDNFGLLGLATGGLVGFFTKFASSILNLNQNTLDIRDNFAKAGGIIPTTTARLGELAKEAGFALDSMKILGDKMVQLSESMSSLGGYAGEGAIKFMQIANVEDSIRRKFGKLGVSQEELLNLQGMYVETQRVSSGYIVNQNKTAEEIQKESLQYAKTLLQLSSLTGDSVEAIQKEVFAARLEMREQARQYRERAEIAKLRREGRGAEADELERRAENRQRVITVLTAMYNKETAMQFATVMETGAITEETTPLALLIPNVQGIAVSLKHSTDINRDLSEAVQNIDTATRNQSRAMSEAITHYPELAERIGLNLENLSKINNRSDTSLETIEAVLEERMQQPDSEDQLASNIENVRSFERESKKLFQTLLEFIDPMRNLNNFLIGALGAAAVALTGLAALKIGSGIIGGLFERGSSFIRPMYIESSGFGGIGAGLAGTAADTSGLGLRRADLVDKNGRPLGGAALDSRLSKLASERTPSTTSFALKQAAKNSVQILKGAATLAGAIITISAGVAGATWLMGKAIPTFAAGMKKFNEVDGDNLRGVGIGMAGLGYGVLALAGEKIAGFFNTLASAFGGQTPLERAVDTLKSFEKIDVDVNKIERNGRATLIFAKAFAQMPSTTISVSGLLAGFFSGPEIPYEEFERFAHFDIDVKKTENNSKAFISFSNAIASYSGNGAINGLGVISTALADSVVKFYDVDPPEKRFKDFSNLSIDHIKAGRNAVAFRQFAEGMNQYKSPPGILTTISSLIGTQINRIFGDGGPVDAFIKFSHNSKDIGPGAAKNARAFFNFARALGMLTGGTSNSGGMLSSISGWFGDDSSSMSSGITSTTGVTGVDPSSRLSEVNVATAKGPWRNDTAFLREVNRVSSKYGFSPGALLGLMQSESGVNPQAVNEKGGATGLIQFMPATARALKTTTAELYRMNRAQQMKYVDDYFSNYASGLRGASAGKLYAYVFLPARANTRTGILTQNPEKYYKQNSGLDQYPRDGRITIAELDQRIALKAREARVGGLFAGPTAGYPMELHGTELIVPVNSNSILMKLASENHSEDNELVNTTLSSTKANQLTKRSEIDSRRIASISNMFERIIDVIDSTDDIDKRILQYT